MMVCERMVPFGPMVRRSSPGSRPRAGAPSTQKSCTQVPAPTTTLGYERKFGLLKVHGLAQALEDADDFEPIPPVGQRLATLLDAVGKLTQLDVKGFLEVHVLDPYITGADDEAVLRVGLEGPEVRVDRLDVDPFVEDLNGGIPGDVIEDEHLSAADDGDLADLVGIQPAHVNVTGDVARVHQVREHDVGKIRLEEGLADGRHALDRSADPVVHDRDIVRCQVPQGIDVLAHDPELEPPAEHVVDLSEGAGIDD